MDERTDREPVPGFYSRGGPRVFGNLYWHWAASAAYLLFAALPALFVALGCSMDALLTTPFAMPWAFVVSVAYPLWAWGELRAFEVWIRDQPAEVRSIERHYFDLMRSSARQFWSAVLASYAIAGIWRLATASTAAAN